MKLLLTAFFTLSHLFPLIQSHQTVLPINNNKPGKLLNPLVLNAYATQDGNVPLLKDDQGFYVAIDLADDSAYASDRAYGPDTVSMMLGLFTSKTLFISSNCTSCQNFTKYDCDKYPCSHQEDIVNYDFPDFLVSTFLSRATAILDYNNWKLAIPAIFAVSSASNVSLPYGSQRNGLLGLGVDKGGKTNFMVFPIFSILIYKNLSSGVLQIASSDPQDNAESTTPVAILQSDTEWKVTVNGSIEVGDDVLNVNSRLIFDLNAEGIGFPLAIYEQIIQSFEEALSMDCTGDTYYPTCFYNGSLSDLPNFVLNIGDQSIPIPPDIYIRSQDMGSNMTLGLRGVNCTLADYSFVTCEYNNYIILGYKFLNYYYTVFDASSSPTITLYIAKAPKNDPAWFATLMEVLGTLIFIMICICCYFACTKKGKSRIANRADPNGSSLQAPLRISQQPTSMVYTQSSSTHEHSQSLFNAFSNLVEEQGHEGRARALRTSAIPVPHEVLAEDPSEEYEN